MDPLIPLEKKVRAMWDSFDPNEKHGVRFGMFPHEKMTEAEGEGEGYTFRELCLGLMDMATRNGGMRA